MWKFKNLSATHILREINLRLLNWLGLISHKIWVQENSSISTLCCIFFSHSVEIQQFSYHSNFTWNQILESKIPPNWQFKHVRNLGFFLIFAFCQSWNILKIRILSPYICQNTSSWDSRLYYHWFHAKYECQKNS